MSNNQRLTVALNRSSKLNDAPTKVTKCFSQPALDRMEATPPKDFSHDPFVSISRAIHSAKLRAGAHLRTMSTSKYPRPRQTIFHTLYQRSARTVVVTLSAIVLLAIFSNLPLSSRDTVPFWHGIHASASSDTPSMTHALEHRPPADTSPRFGTGPWVIALIADLDKESCHVQEKDNPLRQVPCSKANTWVSHFKRGLLSGLFRRHGKATVEWFDEIPLQQRGHFEVMAGEHGGSGGRGMELSELEWFHGHLVTPDDHTGFLSEIMSPRGAMNASEAFYGTPSKVPPSTFRRTVLYDGDGSNEGSTFKSEWMAVKDSQLLVGGHGKPYTDPRDGTVVKSNNPLWVKVVDQNFEVSHVNWTDEYRQIAEAVGIQFPGYLMHEAVLWSEERLEWVFLPRRMSREPFDAEQNEHKGWNHVIIASEDFSSVDSVEIKGLKDPTGLRGFSTAKFVPGTKDRLIAALRTTEVDPVHGEGVRATETYLSIFEIPDGRMVYEEERISGKKYEGLVFL